MMEATTIKTILLLVSVLAGGSPAVDLALGDSIYPNSIAFSVEQLGEDELSAVGMLSVEDELDETLEEYEAMALTGDPSTGQALNNALTEMTEAENGLAAEELAADSTPSNEDDLQAAKRRQRIMERLMAHRELMLRIRAQVPQQAQYGIDTAVSNTERHINRTEARFSELEERTRTQQGDVVLEFADDRAYFRQASQQTVEESNRCRLGVTYPTQDSCECPSDGMWVQKSSGRRNMAGYMCAQAQ